MCKNAKKNRNVYQQTLVRLLKLLPSISSRLSLGIKQQKISTQQFRNSSNKKHVPESLCCRKGGKYTLMWKPVFLFAIEPELESSFYSRQPIISSFKRGEPVTGIVECGTLYICWYQRIVKVLRWDVVVSNNVQLQSNSIISTEWRLNTKLQQKTHVNNGIKKTTQDKLPIV